MKKYLTACSLLALSAMQSALAQTSAPSIEQVVVSASRITIAGYQQPTPVTVVGAAELERDAQTNLGDVIQKLPSVGASSSPNTAQGSQSVSNGSAGSALVNLRNLGSQRTLVLFDGARVVASDPGGGVDLNLLPSNLVERIDVVTGGASAAWGSDAVAGVVNVLLNKNFTGLQANMEGSINTPTFTRKSINVQVDYGTDFLGDRGHLVVGGTWLNSPDTVVPQETHWYRATALVNNPAWTATNGQPKLIHADHVGLSTGTQGGLITSGPLKGIEFVGPNATPTPFNFGNVSGSYSNGGSAVDPALIGEADDLAIPIQTYTFLGYVSYRITDTLRASVMLNYGHTDTDNGSASYTRLGNITVTADNAYLPASIVTAMAQKGISSFPLGTTNVNNCDGKTSDFNTDNNCLGNLSDHVNRTLMRGSVALDGAIFGDWGWNANIQHSQIRRQTHLVNDPIVSNYNNAIDAVTVTASNVGTSGLPLGSIACRSTLTNPANGCKPLDIFGYGPNVQSAAAIDYVSRKNPSYDLLILSQDTAAISIQGQPFTLPAGPVSIVLGAEYRKETVDQTADPLSNARGYAAGNFQNYYAHYQTQEGFAEIDAPLLKNNIVQSLDVNVAGRLTNYSTSGLVETWKLGATSQVIEDLKLRVAYSADIRAPTLTDLFNPGSTSIQVVADPFRNNASTNIFAQNNGNPNLKPEKAFTITGGLVLTPTFIPGLSVSADWYSILIKGAIGSTGFATELAQCYAGLQIFCPSIIRNSSGVITTILQQPLNANQETNSGLDVQANYTGDLFGGTISASWLANYQDEDTVTALGVTTDNAGSLGMEPGNGGGLPKFRTTLSTTYTEGPFSGTVQLRGVGAGKISNAFGPLDVDNNHVDPVGYLDLRGSYRFGDDPSMQLYFAVDNVFDTPPALIPHSTGPSIPYFYVGTRTDIYDALGRMVRVGIRVKY